MLFVHVQSETMTLTLDRPQGLTDRFETLIRDKSFPCVGAKSALARHQMEVMIAGDIRCSRDDGRIFTALTRFAAGYHGTPKAFQSFVVIFETAEVLSEAAFEAALWARAEALETRDASAGFTYDPRVSPDIDDPHFSLSFAGEAFFLVGLHPGASRPARRFEQPVLVFNPHDQFEQLRAEGRYETLRASIIERDVAVAGKPNPMLARHGEISEARQYSGRAVGDGWQCPFHPMQHKEPR